MRPELLEFLRQDHAGSASFEETMARMQELALRIGAGTAPNAARQPVKVK